jgi:hypothetical protein
VVADAAQCRGTAVIGAAHEHRQHHYILAIEPIAVRPAVAFSMIGCGRTRGYELLASGELKSFLDGNSRRILVQSIKDYISRKLSDPATAVMKVTPDGRKRKADHARQGAKA